MNGTTRPIVAIVGRPNVGKSTLFNRLVGRSEAIVHDEPGVTRDRHYGEGHVRGRDIIIVDTGGFDPTDDDPLHQGIARGVDAAIEEADLTLCVFDAQTGPCEADRAAVTRLRRSGKPVVYVANKADNDRRDLTAAELYELGVDRIIAVSALHGRGMHAFEQAVVENLPPARPVPSAPTDALPRIALIGRPNAGKSSLFNRLCGTERSIVDARPGTTVDPIDTEVALGQTRVLLVDTAGIRRKSRVSEGIESASVIRALRVLERTDVAVLLADATNGLAEQDARLIGLCIARGRAVVVGMNKMDQIDREERLKAVRAARDALHFAQWVPVVGISAHTGYGLDRLEAQILRAAKSFHKRITTAQLNRFFRETLERQPPPTMGGRAPRLYYVTQAETAPPVFVVMASSPDRVRPSYRRFVANQIRAAFEFEAVPLIVRFRKKSGKDDT